MRLRPAVTLFECACVVDWLFYSLIYVLCVLYAFVYACWQAPCRAGTACWHMPPTGPFKGEFPLTAPPLWAPCPWREYVPLITASCTTPDFVKRYF